MTMYYQQMSCPFGTVHLYATEQHLKALLFKPWAKVEKSTLTQQSNAVLEQTKSQLNEYFEGTRQTFSIPLESQGTDFQKQVWQTLITIPFGTTWNYVSWQWPSATKMPVALLALPMVKTRFP